MGLLRSKVAGIVFAAVLVGLTGSALAVLTAAQPTTGISGSTGAVLANGASSSDPSATSTTAASPTTDSPNPGNPGNSATPTDTPVRVPTATRTPRPTPTVLPPGQVNNLQGRVVSVSNGGGTSNTGTFVLSVGGRLYTCDVTASTQWLASGFGARTSFSQLRSGDVASVTGMLQPDQITVAAASVNAHADY
jgi:hypothetical protein